MKISKMVEKYKNDAEFKEEFMRITLQLSEQRSTTLIITTKKSRLKYANEILRSLGYRFEEPCKAKVKDPEDYRGYIYKEKYRLFTSKATIASLINENSKSLDFMVDLSTIMKDISYQYWKREIVITTNILKPKYFDEIMEALGYKFDKTGYISVNAGGCYTPYMFKPMY